ncbi:hypothetical protein CC86DRAFT_368380 [Ophiobolus disseminans]|uniref:Uncharacterized protein n=1 Tax=Ophiobolus disseminans TaxID=1469910 RepID=A0A6A7A9G9_9PLEO|nr:hypothetical protein CC86DRAFT_368380 [Ophiobolus disseminans]
MPEIEKSFTFLRDNIPQWLQDVASVQEKVAAMQQEMVRVPTAVSPFARRRTESMESIRPDVVERMGVIAEDPAASQGAQTDPGANRKRKTLSVASGPASGPSRFRRTMVITSYDGDMQKSLELLVRAVGTGRNLLRKAKMQAKMNEFAALAESSEDDDEADDDEDEALTAKAGYRPQISSMRARAAARRVGGRGANGGAGAHVSLFDSTDKTLESAQVLCEKAAHLTLRDGDCRKELDAIRKGFIDVLEVARTEAAKCASTRLLVPSDDRAQDTSDTSVSSVEQPSYKKHFPQISPPSPESQSEPEITLPSIPTVPTISKTLVIEVDDDEDDDGEDFAMPAVRLTSQYRTRA